MMIQFVRIVTAAVLAIATLGACTGETAEPATGEAVAEVTVHKSPTCGCCTDWVEHLREAGFAVEVRETSNLAPVQERVGLPYGLGSCHTAEVEGYFVEGHVPAEDVARLLSERPEAKGLTVPGMPLGSPGMEVPSGEVEAYDVLLVRSDGSTEIFASYPM